MSLGKMFIPNAHSTAYYNMEDIKRPDRYHYSNYEYFENSHPEYGVMPLCEQNQQFYFCTNKNCPIKRHSTIHNRTGDYMLKPYIPTYKKRLPKTSAIYHYIPDKLENYICNSETCSCKHNIWKKRVKPEKAIKYEVRNDMYSTEENSDVQDKYTDYKNKVTHYINIFKELQEKRKNNELKLCSQPEQLSEEIHRNAGCSNEKKKHKSISKVNSLSQKAHSKSTSCSNIECPRNIKKAVSREEKLQRLKPKLSQFNVCTNLKCHEKFVKKDYTERNDFARRLKNLNIEICKNIKCPARIEAKKILKNKAKSETASRANSCTNKPTVHFKNCFKETPSKTSVAKTFCEKTCPNKSGNTKNLKIEELYFPYKKSNDNRTAQNNLKIKQFYLPRRKEKLAKADAKLQKLSQSNTCLKQAVCKKRSVSPEKIQEIIAHLEQTLEKAQGDKLKKKSGYCIKPTCPCPCKKTSSKSCEATVKKLRSRKASKRKCVCKAQQVSSSLLRRRPWIVKIVDLFLQLFFITPINSLKSLIRYFIF